MKPEEKQERIETLFAKAIAIPEANRTEFLDKACVSDPPEVRDEVEKLLEMDAQARQQSGFLAQPPFRPVLSEIRKMAAHAGSKDGLEKTLSPSKVHHLHPTVDLTEHSPHRERSTDVALPKVGDAFGRYRLLRRLGAGGMGVVFEAEDTNAGRYVALKLISHRFIFSREAHVRFRREGILASRVSHPNCVLVLDADECDGIPFIAMELMSGETLEDVVKREGPLDAETAVVKILDVIRGLEEAHRCSVIHRDVKPSNCYVDKRGSIKIGDFGLSKSSEADVKLTQPGQVICTIAYAPPEQLKGQEPTRSNDIYSVAATFYYLLTGKAPFEGEDATATVAHIASSPLPSLRERAPSVTKELEAVVQRGLHRDTTVRFQTMAEFRRALLPFLPGMIQTGSLPKRAGAFLLDYTVLLGVLLLTGGLVLLFNGEISNSGHTEYLLVTLLWFAYYTILEGTWGRSLGKYCFDLHVVRRRDNDTPGLARAASRVIWLLVLWLPHDAFTYFLDVENITSASIGYGLYDLIGPWLIVLILVTSTMRRRNGMRGIHEWLSGTRVDQLLHADPCVHVELVEKCEGETGKMDPASDCPSSIDRYSIIGRRKTPLHACTLIGEDPHLEKRQVWIVLDAPGNSIHGMWRPTRLAFLDSGVWEGRRWEAYLAPEGARLLDLAPLNWSISRSILEQLALDLAEACTDGSLPRVLDLKQVWVAANGQVQLVDKADEKSTLEEWDEQQKNQYALRFLRSVTALCLEGDHCQDMTHQSSSEDSAKRHWIRALLPRQARTVVDRLYHGKNAYKNSAEFREQLVSLRYNPTEVTRRDRARQLALLWVFLLPVCYGTLMVSVELALQIPRHVGNAEAIALILADDQCRDSFLPAVNEEFAYLSPPEIEQKLAHGLTLDRQRLQPNSMRSWIKTTRLGSWLAKTITHYDSELQTKFSAHDGLDVQLVPGQRELSFRFTPTTNESKGEWIVSIEELKPTLYRYILPNGVTLFLGILLFTFLSILPVLSAFIFRGGITLWMSDICVVRRSGRPAWRGICIIRTLIPWFVIASICTMIAWLSTGPVEGGTAIALVLCLASAGALICLIFTIRYPKRSAHDFLLGTYLVPR